MTISRMQQPRQMYGLGSLVKKAVKGITGAVKDVAKSPIGKAAALYFAPALIPGGAKTLGGVFQNMGGLSGIKSALFANPAIYQQKLTGAEKGFFPGLMDKFSSMSPLARGATMFGVGALGGGALQALEAAGVEDPETQIRDVDALEGYLRQGYLELNPNASSAEVEEFVQSNTREYRSIGGRIGYAIGSPEENAMKASGIMGLPLNQNPAGITELDLRDSGGFIPPVGVKEKADDIPAMLSNNEFVFTADAVRGMGDGDVNKGAQRMYDMMKKLENGGRV